MTPCLTAHELAALVGTGRKIRWHPDYFADGCISPSSQFDMIVVSAVNSNCLWVVVTHPRCLDGDRIINDDGTGVSSNQPVFILANAKTMKVSIVADLKSLNSRHDVFECASCGGLLKVPYPRIKYCPRCEP